MLATAYPALDAALGGSIVADELKGSPGRAVELATAALQNGDAAARVDLALALILSGRPGAAHRLLEEAIATAPPEVALLAAAYERLATSLRFNAFADGQGAGGLELSARWNGVADEAAAERRMAALEASAPAGSPAQHVRMLTGLLTALRSVRTVLELARTMPDAQPGRFDTLVTGITDLDRRPDAPPGWAAYASLATADLLRRAGHPEQAWERLSEAQQRYEAIGDGAGAAVCVLTAGDWLAAPFSSPLCLNLALRESASEGGDLDWRIEDAEFASAGLDAAAAAARYAAAEALFESAGAPRGVAAVALRRSYLAMLDDDPAATAAHAADARARFAAAGDLHGEHLAAVHAALADVARGALAGDAPAAAAIGRWGAAEGSFSVALGHGLLFCRAGRHWLLRRGDPERAIACHRLAAALFEALGAGLNRAQSLVDQADALATVGDAGGAFVLYDRAIAATVPPAGAPEEVAAQARRRGLLLALEVMQDHHARQDADGMERAATAVMARLREAAASPSPEPPEQLVTAFAMEQLGGIATAIPLARAMKLREQGRDEEARPSFDTALEQAGDDGNLFAAAVLASQQRFAEARERYDRHVATRDRIGGAGMLARLLGGDQVARLRRDQLSEDLAFAVRLREWDAARAAAEDLAAEAGPRWYDADPRPWSVLSDLGEMLEGQGRLHEALARYEEAAAAFEAARGRIGGQGLRGALAAGKDVQWLSFLATRCALRLADEEPAAARAAEARAFAFAERGRARVLLDLMARGAARPGGEREPPLRRRWRELGVRLDAAAQALQRRQGPGGDAAEVAALEREVQDGQAALRAIEDELDRTDPGWLGGVRASGEVAPLEDVAAALPPGTALLQWAFLGDDLLAWAITRDGMVAHARRDVDARRLGRSIRELRAACERGAGDWAQRSAAVAGALLEPVAGALRDHERLVVVPYGVAHQLPFHLLVHEGRPLLETHVLTTLPSAGALLHTGGRGGRPWRVLAVGNPARMAYRPAGAAAAIAQSALQGAEAEATLAAAAFDGGLALIGADATEDAVRERLPDFPLLHFATHAVLDEAAPGRSSLLLRDGDELTVYELAGLELDVDLAVLSACSTGQGEASRGDEVVGLGRALLGAGCRTAVVSLWPVDDLSTALLMEAFYRALRGGADAAGSLRAAMLELRTLGRPEAAERLAALRERVPPGTRAVLTRPSGSAAATPYDHPYHWGSFTLVGAPAPPR